MRLCNNLKKYAQGDSIGTIFAATILLSRTDHIKKLLVKGCQCDKNAQYFWYTSCSNYKYLWMFM